MLFVCSKSFCSNIFHDYAIDVSKPSFVGHRRRWQMGIKWCYDYERGSYWPFLASFFTSTDILLSCFPHWLQPFPSIRSWSLKTCSPDAEDIHWTLSNTSLPYVTMHLLTFFCLSRQQILEQTGSYNFADPCCYRCSYHTGECSCLFLCWILLKQRYQKFKNFTLASLLRDDKCVDLFIYLSSNRERNQESRLGHFEERETLGGRTWNKIEISD